MSVLNDMDLFRLISGLFASKIFTRLVKSIFPSVLESFCVCVASGIRMITNTFLRKISGITLV